MKKKKIGLLIKVVIFTAIPSFLSYVASSPTFLNQLVVKGIIGNSVPLDIIRDLCFISGIILSAILLSWNLICKTTQYEDVLEQRNYLIKMNKDNLKIVLSDLSSGFSSFDIRIFIPRYPKLYMICNKIGIDCKREFIIKNIDIIANQGATKNLKFEVYPNTQGLVGQCYKSKAMVYDDQLEKTNNTKYSLTEGQISRTSNLKWSICCPIINENNEVVSVMAFDGTENITIDRNKQKELSDNILTYTRMLYDAVPQLFRR